MPHEIGQVPVTAVSARPAQDAPQRIGVVGVGNMGLAIALRLAELGHALTVHDLLPAREAMAAAGGCAVAADPAAVARVSSLLLVVVVDGTQTEQVLWGAGTDTGRPGAACALQPGSAVMLCPTIAPADVERHARRLAERGVHTLDCPMSGGPARARAGRMSLMVAADDAVLARCQPVLAQIADPVFHVGQRPGDGARIKLVNNLLAAVNLAGAAEAMALAGRLGLDPAATLAVIEQSSGQSWIGSDRLQRALAGRSDVLAHVGLLAKDSALALAEARACGAPVALGAAAAAQFAAAQAQGLAQQDDSVLVHWLARQGGRDEGKA